MAYFKEHAPNDFSRRSMPAEACWRRESCRIATIASAPWQVCREEPPSLQHGGSRGGSYGGLRERHLASRWALRRTARSPCGSVGSAVAWSGSASRVGGAFCRHPEPGRRGERPPNFRVVATRAARVSPPAGGPGSLSPSPRPSLIARRRVPHSGQRLGSPKAIRPVDFRSALAAVKARRFAPPAARLAALTDARRRPAWHLPDGHRMSFRAAPDNPRMSRLLHRDWIPFRFFRGLAGFRR